ncbi:hypothetical protein D3C86_1737910 [compost metagenome]
MKEGGKPVHALFEQRFQRFWRHIAAGKAGAARRDDHIHAFRERPLAHGAGNRFLVIRHDGAGGKPVACFFQPCDERIAGFVILQRAAVRNGQNRNAQGNEGSFACHGLILECREHRTEKCIAVFGKSDAQTKLGAAGPPL